MNEVETTAAGHDAITVLVVDDQALVRAGFVLVLDNDPDVKVVGEATNGRQAIELTRRLRPDVVLMDVRMPEMDGIEATRQILGDPGNNAKVVILTTFDQDDYISDALRAGASGYLVKDLEPDELRQAVKVVAGGEALLSPAVTTRLLEILRRQPDHQPRHPERLEVLTDREREVVALVGEGLSNDDIAQRLFISPATAKTHVSRALGKLLARDRAQLVAIAHETGLVGRGPA